KFTCLGLFLVAPSLHYWYGFLAKQFPTSTLKRVVFDQFLYAPLFLTVFIFLNDYLDNYNYISSLNKVQSEIQNTVLVNWVLWIPFQSFNFRFVPTQFQVLANNSCALF